jgi:hypothetical protein
MAMAVTNSTQGPSPAAKRGAARSRSKRTPRWSCGHKQSSGGCVGGTLGKRELGCGGAAAALRRDREREQQERESENEGE